MPSALAISRSSGVVTKPCTRSASAPTYTVDTVITAFCSSGYWRTLSSTAERKPTRKISRLTTVASTGFWMKMSVNFMAARPISCSAAAARTRRRVGSSLFTSTGTPLRSFSRPDVAISSPGSRPPMHLHEIAAPAAELHEAPLDAGFSPHEHPDGVAVRVVAHRGLRHHRDLLARPELDLDLREHAGAQHLVRVRERRLHLEAARSLVDPRLDRGDRAVKIAIAERLDADLDRHPDAHVAELLLRQHEVHEDRVERLERHDARAGRQVIAEIHLANSELARERRADHLLRDPRALRVDLRLRGGRRGRRADRPRPPRRRCG